MDCVRGHPIFCASDTYRATWCIHLSAPSSPSYRPFPRAPLDLPPDQRSKTRFFHRALLSRAPPVFLHFFLRLSIHITTTNYTQPYGHPSLLAGLLNGYNLALFTTRAARSPVWQVSPQRSFLWEANRRRSLSSPASKSKIILSLGFLTAAINRSSEPRIIHFIYRYFQSFL